MKKIIDLQRGLESDSETPVSSSRQPKNIKFWFWKKEIDIIQSVAIAVLLGVILWSSFLNPLGNYQKRLDNAEEQLKRAEQRNVVLEFDRVRLEDATNILLAIQDFYFQKNSFPKSLEDLKKRGYLDPNSRLIDPDTNQPYFYQKSGQDFVLCVWLSDMIKGINTTGCPSSNRQEETAMPVKSKTDELEIVGDVPFVNVREQPTIKSSVIARVIPGDEYVFTERRGDWYHIIVNSEKSGWVRNDYAELLITE